MPLTITKLKLANSLAELIHRDISQRLNIDDDRYIVITKDNNGDVHTKIFNRNTDKIIVETLYKQSSLGYEEITKRIWESLL